MSLRKARELGVEIEDQSGEFEFVERWTWGDTRLEVRNVKTTEPLTAGSQHYVRKINIENGKVIWVSEAYATRASARAAAYREFKNVEANIIDNGIPVEL